MNQRELPYKAENGVLTGPTIEGSILFFDHAMAEATAINYNKIFESGRLLSKEEIRFAWEEGFKLCRSYADNHFHFQGEQKERMDSFIAACAGRRITYKNLTA